MEDKKRQNKEAIAVESSLLMVSIVMVMMCCHVYGRSSHGNVKVAMAMVKMYSGWNPNSKHYLILPLNNSS